MKLLFFFNSRKADFEYGDTFCVNEKDDKR